MALEVAVEAERSVPDGIAIASKYKKTEGCTLLADVFALLCHLSAPDQLTFSSRNFHLQLVVLYRLQACTA